MKNAGILWHMNIWENWVMKSIVARNWDTGHVKNHNGVERTVMEGKFYRRKGLRVESGGGHRTLMTPWIWGGMKQEIGNQSEVFWAGREESDIQ